MTGPPWGHKPPKVDDHYRYWRDPPPELSPRVEYWLRRIAEGSWKPNRWFWTEGYDDQCQILGVYMWEYLSLICPLMVAVLEGQCWPHQRELGLTLQCHEAYYKEGKP
jgi:hypothetical protein